MNHENYKALPGKTDIVISIKADYKNVAD